MIRLYLRVMKLALLQQVTYRTALLAGLATNFFFGLLRAAVLLALFQVKPAVNGMTQAEGLTFVAFSQALIAFLFIFGTYDVMNTVYTGSIGADLARPVDLFFYWMARDFGASLVNLVARGIVLVLLFGIFYPVVIPASLGQWAVGLVALLLGWGINYGFRFLVNLTAFWTPDARGIGRAAYTMLMMFSGFYMPMRLYPDAFSRLCSFMPFPAIFNTPMEIFMGLLKGPEIIPALLAQVGWLAALWLLSRVALRRGLRKLVIQGG